MTTKLLAVTILAAVSVSAAPEGGGIEAWVGAAGGFVKKDAAGRVTEVSLRGAWLTESDIGRISGFTEIRRLDLSLTHINDRDLEPIRLLTNLEDLSLTYAEHISDAGLARIRHVKTLQKLDLEGTKVTDSGMGALAGLTQLRSLSLRATQITDSALEQLDPLVNLEELRIGGNRIAGFGLVFLQALPNLKRLDLSGAQLTDDGVWSVALSDLNIETIATLHNLEVLNLAAADLPAVAAIPDGGIRETANLNVTDVGLTKLRSLKRLRSLDVTRSAIGPEGLQALRELPNLERLVVSNALRIDDTAVPALLQLKGLRQLDLTGTKITPKGLDSIRRAFSGITVWSRMIKLSIRSWA